MKGRQAPLLREFRARFNPSAGALFRAMKLRALMTSLLFTTASPGAEATGTGVAVSTNALGLDLYRLTAAEPGNLLLSPYSIQSALCMTLGGAGGKTREEMAKVLHVGADSGKVAGEFAALRVALEKAVTDSEKQAKEMKQYGGSMEPLKLRVANRLFGRDGYPFRGEFLKQTQDVWQAPLETVAFAKKPEAARKHINGWVEDQTAKRIVDLIPPGGVNETTRLVLVNALYFKAAWENDFSERVTKPLPFFVPGGSPANVPTMFQQRRMGYKKESGYSAVTITYTGHALHFLIILPDAKEGLPAVEKALTADKLTALSKLPSDQEVMLYLPKFKLQPPTLPLAKPLRALGMKTAFDDPPGSADFSGMAPRTPDEYLMISDVYHKTFMALDEKGTEAAAATAVAMKAGSAMMKEKPKPVEFRADHPFLFAIQHRESGVCLFLGRMSDPR